jgi:SAM-dependent methyltransferase
MCPARRERILGPMRGYDDHSYGDAFADVYDEWYAGVSDVGATVERMVDVAGDGGRVLELGVGTGRLAVPMAQAGLVVVGVDSSEAMLERLRRRDPDGAVTVVRGDMVADLPEGPFDAALVAYNTIFNLLDEAAQRRCFAAVADRLVTGGSFVVEAFVPDVATHATTPTDVSVRSLAVDRVVLSVTVNDPADQRAEGQFVEFTEAGGVRLRPWAIRWATPDQLDAMAAAAGLALADRWADMTTAAFDDDSTAHVSVYERRP